MQFSISKFFFWCINLKNCSALNFFSPKLKNKFENACRVLEFNTYDIDFYQVKLQYRKLAKKYHPDKFENSSKIEKEKAENMMKDINEAYGYLMKK